MNCNAVLPWVWKWVWFTYTQINSLLDNIYVEVCILCVILHCCPMAAGFLCPVHTPDGAPCGLLNHLAAPCKVSRHNCGIFELRIIQGSAHTVRHWSAVTTSQLFFNRLSPSYDHLFSIGKWCKHATVEKNFNHLS